MKYHIQGRKKEQLSTNDKAALNVILHYCTKLRDYFLTILRGISIYSKTLLRIVRKYHSKFALATVYHNGATLASCRVAAWYNCYRRKKEEYGNLKGAIEAYKEAKTKAADLYDREGKAEALEKQAAAEEVLEKA